MQAATASSWRPVAAIASCAMFMTQLDGAVLATALPRIAADFGVPTMSLSLSITIYLTALVAMLPAGGWIADRFEPRRVFVLATTVFLVGSLACAACTSYWPFIAARAVQGLGASLMGPVAMLLLLKTTPKERRVSALSWATAPMLLAPTFGPTLSGFLVTFASWPVIFLLNLPLGFGALAFAYRHMPQAPERKRQPLDAIGLLLTSGALVAVLTGLDRVAAPGGTWAGAATLTVGVVLTTFAIRHIRRHPHPILPLAPLRDATFRLAGLIAGPLIRLSMRALPFLLPLMFQLELGMSALVAGAMLLALNGGDLVIKPVVATIIGRFGFRNALAAVGAIGCAAGLACVWFEAGFPVTLVIAILAVSGMSRSVLFTGLASLAYSEIAPEDMTAANVLMNITQQVTAALAVSLSALLLQSTAALRGAAEPGLTDFRIALVALVVLGAAGSLLLFRLGSATPVAPQPQPMDLELTDPDR